MMNRVWTTRKEAEQILPTLNPALQIEQKVWKVETEVWMVPEGMNLYGRVIPQPQKDLYYVPQAGLNNAPNIPEDFKTGVRGILLLHRKKDGAVANAQTKSLKRISRGAEEWQEIVSYFQMLQSTPLYENFRIYASVNSRNMNKAIHEFSKRKIDADFSLAPLRNDFYTDIKNRFFSCLMEPNQRDTKYFLWDFDSPEEEKKGYPLITSENAFEFGYATKNGSHVISKPFDPRKAEGLTMHKDGLMFIS